MQNILVLIVFLIIVLGLIFLIQFYIYRSYRRWVKKAILPDHQKTWKNCGNIVIIFGNILFIINSFALRSQIFKVSFITSLLSYLGGLFFSSILLAFIILLLKDLTVFILFLVNYSIKFVKGYFRQGLSGSENVHDSSRRIFLKYCGVTTMLAASSGPVFSLFKTTNDYEILKKSLSFHNFPRGMNGLTIAHISDIHSGVYMKEREMAEIFHTVNSLRPDMIVITGDFVDRNTIDIKTLSKVLQTLESDIGVFGCLGNHDHYAGSEKINNMLESSDIIMLNNNSKTLLISDEPMSIIGVDYSGTSMHRGDYADLNKAMETVNRETFKILLSHNPEFFSEAKKADIDLTLAGHTHGGQIGFELAGININPAYAAFKYPKGLYIEDNKLLYVNVGVGTFGLPIRTIKPEITLFTLSNRNQRSTDGQAV
ncbi:metallophosphoesterase [Thermodesulfobacteriota bacterium]